jgi:hypothetical protein
VLAVITDAFRRAVTAFVGVASMEACVGDDEVTKPFYLTEGERRFDDGNHQFYVDVQFTQFNCRI